MLTKWLNLASGRNQQDALEGKTNGNRDPVNSANGNSAPSNHANADANDKSLANFRGDLLTHEDIYRSVGIISLRLGYGINTVVDMLNSEHLRGLSNDVKRASVLMALEAAGIPLDEVLRDAAQRQDAINV